MNEDCLFCKIAAGEMDADVVDEGDDWIAFRDIDPQAPTHVLVIPREHVPRVDDLTAEHDALVGRMFRAAADVAESEGIVDPGYRLVMNSGRGAGQSVFHIHLHVLGGRTMSWPPG